VVVAVLAILASIVIQNVFSALDSARVSRTMADMKVCSLALTELAVRTDGYPAGVHPMKDLEARLESTVGRAVPTVDAWGHDLYYFSPDAVSLGRDKSGIAISTSPSFQIQSFGKDGVPDAGLGSGGKGFSPASSDPAPVVTGVWVDFDSDLVIEGEVFIQAKW